MENKHKPDLSGYSPEPRNFFIILVQGLIQDAVILLMAFAIGTLKTAIACWYYDVPLIFSLAGGFIILGLALGVLLVVKSDSLFS